MKIQGSLQIPNVTFEKSNLTIQLFRMTMVQTLWPCLHKIGHGPPPPYGAPAGPHPVEKLPPQPFTYQYGVKDDYSGASFDKSESQNAEDIVAGKKKH